MKKEKLISKEEAGDKIRYYYAEILVGVKEQDILDDNFQPEDGYDWLCEKLNDLLWDIPAEDRSVLLTRDAKQEEIREYANVKV